jgi:hypothetical protein
MTVRLCAIIPVTALLLAACSTTEQLQIPEVCQRYLSAGDIEEIRALLASRPDIRQPLWGINCDDRGRLIAESGSGDICSLVTLTRQHGKWHILSIKDQPVVVVTAWLPNRPNHALQPTASRRENLPVTARTFNSVAQLALVSGG